MTTPSEKLRDAWLKALLPLVPDGGWTAELADKAANDAELSKGEQSLAAPNGVTDLIDHFFDRAGDVMLEILITQDLNALRAHERVASGLRAWLDVLEPNKEAVRKAANLGLLPWGAGAAARRVWRVADTVWEAAGDTATDYNRQTKRALLSAVIPSVVMKWLNTSDQVEVDQHIETRLKQAMNIGQAGSKMLKPVLEAFEALKGKV
ncbi:MAG: COQ9 family protein [Henriciella sp.]|jgi:ubiquinone biosynthesis protein COQ9